MLPSNFRKQNKFIILILQLKNLSYLSSRYYYFGSKVKAKKMISFICLAINIIYFEGAFGTFQMHDNEELSQYPTEGFEQMEFNGFCELDCKHKCSKTTDSGGGNYYNSNQSCIVFKNTNALVLSNKYNMISFSRSMTFVLFILYSTDKTWINFLKRKIFMLLSAVFYIF